jgi:hypothetical protein
LCWSRGHATRGPILVGSWRTSLLGRTAASRRKRAVASTLLGEPDCLVGINRTLAAGDEEGGTPMPTSYRHRQTTLEQGIDSRPEEPLEPKHVWSTRVRLEIARSRRDLAIFNLAIDSKLRACGLVKSRLDDVFSGAKVRHRATRAGQSSSRSRSDRGTPSKPRYQCAGVPVSDISSQVDFMQVRAIRGRCSLLACARIFMYGYMPTSIKYAFDD